MGTNEVLLALRERRAYLVAGLGLAAICAGFVAVGLGAPFPALIAHANMSVITSFFGAACCVYAGIRGSKDARLSWALFALVLSLYGWGDTLWLIYGGAAGTPAILSAADALYLSALVPAVFGLVLYPATRGWKGTLGPLVFDAAVLGAAALLISYVLVFEEVVRADCTFLDMFLLLVYPITDVLLVCLVLLLLIRSVGEPRPDLFLLGLCFATYGVADNGYALLTIRGQDSLGTVVDLGFIVAPLFMACAAIWAGTRPHTPRTMQRHLNGVVAPLFPDLSTIAALGVFVTLQHQHGSASWILAAAALALTGIRQLALTSDRQRVRLDLEQRIAVRTVELRELTAAHDQLDLMKYEFVSAVSHELRTPLTAIHGALEMLADGDAGELPKPAQGVVDMANRGTQRLARLVDDIIDLERLERGSFSFRPQPEPLAPLLADAVAPMVTLAADRGITLTLEQVDQSAWCDSDRIIQAMVNLVGNALKFTPAGGSVTVSVATIDDLVVVSVADEGRGIPTEALTSIFERFHQVEAGDDRRYAGAGLGLTITKYIVEGHGGRIWAESEIGRGSTFRFTLPKAPVASVQQSPPVVVDVVMDSPPNKRRPVSAGSSGGRFRRQRKR